MYILQALHTVNASLLDTLIVTSLERLEVTAGDLAGMKDRKQLFHRIKEPVFATDIDKTSFVNSVIGIYSCEKVEVPETIPKLIQLSRIK